MPMYILMQSSQFSFEASFHPSLVCNDCKYFGSFVFLVNFVLKLFAVTFRQHKHLDSMFSWDLFLKIHVTNESSGTQLLATKDASQEGSNDDLNAMKDLGNEILVTIQSQVFTLTEVKHKAPTAKHCIYSLYNNAWLKAPCRGCSQREINSTVLLCEVGEACSSLRSCIFVCEDAELENVEKSWKGLCEVTGALTLPLDDRLPWRLVIPICAHDSGGKRWLGGSMGGTKTNSWILR